VFIHRLSVDDSREEKEERKKERKNNCVSHVTVLRTCSLSWEWGYYIRLVALGVLYKACSFGDII
jgi:hypothetical protein